MSYRRAPVASWGLTGVSKGVPKKDQCDSNTTFENISIYYSKSTVYYYIIVWGYH